MLNQNVVHLYKYYGTRSYIHKSINNYSEENIDCNIACVHCAWCSLLLYLI